MKYQKITKTYENIWKIITYANQYIDSQSPWSLTKNISGRLETILFTITEFIYIISIFIKPIIPSTSKKILTQINMHKENILFTDIENKNLIQKRILPSPQIIFPKVAKHA